MFTVYCPGHSARVLLSSDSIEAIANEADGIVVRWRCGCGEVGVWRPSRGRSR